MEDGHTLLMKVEAKRAEGDRNEAIVFLAAIIPKEDRERIHSEIENDPEFVGKQHMFLGLKVRNALRMSDFFYSPHLMDYIWFPWLRDAVSLPEEKIILTESIKERITKYQEALDRNIKQEATMRDTHQKPLVKQTQRWTSEKDVILVLALVSLILFLLSLIL